MLMINFVYLHSLLRSIELCSGESSTSAFDGEDLFPSAILSVLSSLNSVGVTLVTPAANFLPVNPDPSDVLSRRDVGYFDDIFLSLPVSDERSLLDFKSI